MVAKPNADARRLLVISYHFPPDGAIGGQRWAGLSKYLARLGWEVHVITAAARESQSTVPGVTVHVCPRRRTLNDVYKHVALRFRRAATEDPQVSGSSPDEGRANRLGLLGALRRLGAGAMHFPDVGRGWVGTATSTARALLRERRFDAVVSSGPPHSAHFAALLATAGGNTQFWIDMRDPWSMTHAMTTSKDWLVRIERILVRGLEAILLARASRVLVNTQAFASALRETRSDLEVVYLPNGTDLEALPVRDVTAVERGSVSYVGTMYARRNLSSMCEAMRKVLNDRPEAAATLRLNIAGPMTPSHRRQMEEDIDRAGLTSVIRLHGMLSRAKAIELLLRSEVALVLAQRQPMQVPAKLYECVGMGIPTLVITEATSAAAAEARRVGAATLDGADVDGMRALLEDMLARRTPLAKPSSAPISYQDLAMQMDRLLGQTAVRRQVREVRELSASATPH